jgi:hypothetical protein
MNDDQLVQLLRETPLPADPSDRYEAVAAKRRGADRRRWAALSASLAVVLVVGTVSVVTLRDHPSTTDVATLLTGRADTAHLVMKQTSLDGKESVVAEWDIDFAQQVFSSRTISATGPHRAALLRQEWRRIGSDIWLTAATDLPLGKKWIHTRVAAGAHDFRFSPAAILNTLRHANGTVTRIGSAKVDGVETVKYRVAVDGPQGFLPDGVGEIYVDGRGFVRRVSTSDDKSQLTVTLSEFGKAVTVMAPPASEVMESSEIGHGPG